MAKLDDRVAQPAHTHTPAGSKPTRRNNREAKGCTLHGGQNQNLRQKKNNCPAVPPPFYLLNYRNLSTCCIAPSLSLSPARLQAIVPPAGGAGGEDRDDERGISMVPGSIVVTSDLAMSREACGRPMDLALCPIFSSLSRSAKRSLTSCAISLGSFRYRPKSLSVT